MEGTRIGLLATSRKGGVGLFGRGGEGEVTLDPLSPQSSQHLLDEHRPGFPPRARDRLLGQAAGNPLAILELADGLNRLPDGNLTPLPDILPLTARLESSFAFRIADFPDSTRRALLLLALDGRDDLRAAVKTGISLDYSAPLNVLGLSRWILRIRWFTFGIHLCVRPSSGIRAATSSDKRI